MPEIQVVGEGEVPVETKPEPAPTAVQEPVIINTGAQSPLALLRANREKLKADLFLDLKVPRWEVGGRQLWVRYGPGSPSVLADTAERLQAAHKPGMPDWKVRANADVLVKACLAIYDLPTDEKPPDVLPVLDDPYPVFTSDVFQESMGVGRNAIDAVCALYLTEGDLILATNTLLDWSGIVSQKVADDFLAS